MIAGQSLRLAASEVEEAGRALLLALKQCEALKAEVAALKAERDAYFKPRADGDVSVNARRDDTHGVLQFRVTMGNAYIASAVDQGVFVEDARGDALVYMARNAAQGIAHMIGEKIAPLLAEAYKNAIPKRE